MKTRRMPRFALASCQALAVLALTACGGGGSDDGGSPGASTQHEVSVEGGQTRSYTLYLPSEVDRSSPMSLVLLYHGGFGSPQTILKSTDMEAKAEAEGFVLATLKASSDGLLNGNSRVWNAGYEGKRPSVDDVAFTRAVIEQVADTENIDLDRVYAAGFSQGGAMVYRLACQASDRIAAVGVVSGYTSQTTNPRLGQSYSCDRPDLAHPVPILHIHGLADQCVDYNGGQGEGFNSRTRRTPIPTTIANWSERNGCDNQTEPTSNPGNATEIRDKCEAGSVVRLRTIPQQGHVWPGEARYGLQGQCEGKQTGAVDATDRFWDFVKGFRLNQLTKN